MGRRPSPYFDLEYIGSLSDEPKELMYFSEREMHVINLLSPMVLWRTRWYSGYQRVSVPDFAHEIVERLKIPMHLEDVVQAIYDTSCCTSGTPSSSFGSTWSYEFIGPSPEQEPDNVTVGDPSPPQGFLDNPLADYDSSGSIGWEDFSVYLCDAAYRLVDGLELIMKRLELASTLDLFAIAREVVGDIIRWLLPGKVDDWIILTWTAFMDLVTAVGDWVTGSPDAADWASIWSAWEGGVRQQVLCHVSQATDADTAAADVRADMQSLFAGAAWSAIWTVYPFRRIMREVFQGAQPYEGPVADCDCVDTASKMYTFDSGNEGWENADLSPALWLATFDTQTGLIQKGQTNPYYQSPHFTLDAGTEIEWDVWYYPHHSTGLALTVRLYKYDAGTDSYSMVSGSEMSISPAVDGTVKHTVGTMAVTINEGDVLVMRAGNTTSRQLELDSIKVTVNPV